MTLDEVKKQLNIKRDNEVAKFFGVSQQAVSLWRNTGSIPLLRQYQMKEKLNELQV